jgi:hypothetical protein
VAVHLAEPTLRQPLLVDEQVADRAFAWIEAEQRHRGIEVRHRTGHRRDGAGLEVDVVQVGP